MASRQPNILSVLSEPSDTGSENRTIIPSFDMEDGFFVFADDNCIEAQLLFPQDLFFRLFKASLFVLMIIFILLQDSSSVQSPQVL